MGDRPCAVETKCMCMEEILWREAEKYRERTKRGEPTTQTGYTRTPLRSKTAADGDTIGETYRLEIEMLVGTYRFHRWCPK